jgi:ADP-heptose:LPS heptosyltransferase
VLIGPADANQLDYLQRHLLAPAPELLTLLVNAPLLEVAQRLQQCRCYLGNDSGVTHLAALLGVPTVALFGPSDPAIWRPVGRTVSLLYEPDLATLPVEAVVAQIEGLLSY